MDNWFECKISYDKITDDGMPAKTKEAYLVDALSFTEAEARIQEECRPFVSGDLTVTDIKRARISEIFYNPEGDRYYKAKVVFVEIDIDSGTERRAAHQMLAQASTIEGAIEVIKAGMRTSSVDYVIASIAESTLMDVFPFSNESKETRAVQLEPDDE
ncbi:MAG: DUF4494 domain-containing protein [Tannerella sp.]|jgi:hypothetical protein|nr:DUF4494 domain-containing protein [Tannerella sp.]